MPVSNFAYNNSQPGRGDGWGQGVTQIKVTAGIVLVRNFKNRECNTTTTTQTLSTYCR